MELKKNILRKRNEPWYDCEYEIPKFSSPEVKYNHSIRVEYKIQQQRFQ